MTRAGLDRITVALLWLALALTVLHQADHVLRVDHSGWPFLPRVSPFTYSFAAYPIILFALLGPRRLYWLRWALLAAAAAITVYAHTAVEAPQDQLAMWAHNRSGDPRAAGVENLPRVRSPALGWLAMTVSMALNVTAVTAAVAMLANGARPRRE